jgi:hypothetical protein
VSIDWEFPGWSANGNFYDKNDGIYLSNFIEKLK